MGLMDMPYRDTPAGVLPFGPRGVGTKIRREYVRDPRATRSGKVTRRYGCNSPLEAGAHVHH